MNNIPSKETIQLDLKNTEKEINAYAAILGGYRDLQSLPENPPGKYRLEIMRFETSLSECQAFYEKLKGIFGRINK